MSDVNIKYMVVYDPEYTRFTEAFEMAKSLCREYDLSINPASILFGSAISLRGRIDNVALVVGSLSDDMEASLAAGRHFIKRQRCGNYLR